jgi:hypothetical protein
VEVQKLMLEVGVDPAPADGDRLAVKRDTRRLRPGTLSFVLST